MLLAKIGQLTVEKDFVHACTGGTPVLSGSNGSNPTTPNGPSPAGASFWRWPGPRSHPRKPLISEDDLALMKRLDEVPLHPATDAPDGLRGSVPQAQDKPSRKGPSHFSHSFAGLGD